MKVQVGARSDIGRARKRNEDSFLVRDPLFAVADGMGGHRGGNVASAMSVERLEALDLPREGGLPALVEAVKHANRAVFERGEAEQHLSGMGTTVTAFLMEGATGHIAHVGDSRAYLLRDGEIQRLTKDHTLVQRWVDEGRLQPEEAERHQARSILTRTVGVEGDIAVDELTLDLHEGDRILLCSDGLSGMLDETTIRDVLATETDPQAASDSLVDLANGAGGDDNITVIVLDVVTEGRDGAVDGDAPGPEATEDVAATRAAQHPPARRRRWRRAAVWVAAAIVVLTAALGGTRWYVDRQWYVGDSDGSVAIYNGIPATVLGVHLSHVDRVFPQLPASTAEQLQPWQGLKDGITARGRLDALNLVDRIGQDLGVTGVLGPSPGNGPSPGPTATSTTPSSTGSP